MDFSGVDWNDEKQRERALKELGIAIRHLKVIEVGLWIVVGFLSCVLIGLVAKAVFV